MPLHFFQNTLSCIAKENGQSEIISEEELAQLIKMSDQLEKANVRRLKYIIELSKIRNVSARELMSQLGIPLGGHA